MVPPRRWRPLLQFLPSWVAVPRGAWIFLFRLVPGSRKAQRRCERGARAKLEFSALHPEAMISWAEDQVSRAEKAWRVVVSAEETGATPKILRRSPTGVYVAIPQSNAEFERHRVLLAQ